MQLTTCPSTDHLSTYLRGDLSAAELDEIADHVATCAECDTAIGVLEKDSDTLMFALRQRLVADDFEREPELQRAVAAIRADFSEPASSDSVLGSVREYDLLEKIGAGGMGTVYKALHSRLKKIVALKVLAEHRLNDPAAVTRFSREMQAVGKLAHPNIVKALDAGEADGRHYLVMEYIDGIDLSRLSRRCGPLPVAESCELVLQAALALQHAHEHDLVHRDVKPSNLMLTADGNVKVLDLGIALLHPDEPATSDLTGTGQIMGTLDYMAPEQLDNTHTVDIRADVYGLGATLYKLLSGSAPATDSESRFRMPGEAIPPAPSIRTIRPDIPKPVAAVIERMLAPNPDQRYETPATVAEALQPFTTKSNLPQLAIAATSDTPLKPTHLPTRLRRWTRRLLLTAALLTGIALAGFAITVQTDKGQLVIKSDVDDIEVLVKRSGKLYDSLDALEVGKGKNHWSFRSGSYEVRLVGKTDGLRVEGGTFTLVHGEKSVVTITREGKEKTAVVAGPVYEGKTLDEWLTLLKTEKSLKLRGEALKAIEVLGDSKPDATIEALLLLGSEYDLFHPSNKPLEKQIWEWAFRITKQLSPERVPQAAIDALDSSNVKIRRIAVYVLATNWGRMPPISLVRKAAKDPDAEVRRRSMEWITLYGREGIPDLVKAFDAEVSDVRRTAVFAVLSLGNERKITPEHAQEIQPKLYGMLHDKVPAVRYEVLRALSTFAMDENKLIATLAEAVGDPDDVILQFAIRSLGARGSKAEPAVPALLNALKKQSRKTEGEKPDVESWNNRSYRFPTPKVLISTLGRIGPSAKDTVPVIKEFLQHEHPGVRAAAVVAVKQITGEVIILPGDKAKEQKETPVAGPVYDGKTFDQWIAELKTERKAEQLADAFNALRLLRQKNRDRETADAIIQVMRNFYTIVPDESRHKLFRVASKNFSSFDDSAAHAAMRAELEGGTRSGKVFVLHLLRSRHISRPGLPSNIQMELVPKELVPALLKASRDPSMLKKAPTDWFNSIHEMMIDLLTRTDGKSDAVRNRLREALNDDGKGIADRAAAALVIQAPNSPELVPVLLRLVRNARAASPVGADLKNVSDFYRLSAANVLVVLKKHIKNKDPQIREAAAEAIRLIKGYGTKPGDVKPAAPTRKTTGPVYDGRTFDQWITLLKTDKSAQRQVDGIKALAALRTEKNAPSAVATIIDLGSEHSLELSDRNLGGGGQFVVSDDQQVLTAVHQTFHRIGGKQVVPPLLEALGSKDVQRRRFAANALSRFPFTESMLPSIIKAAHDTNPGVRRLVPTLLSKAGERGVPELTRMLEHDKDIWARADAAMHLLNLGEKARPALPQLLAAVSSPHPGIRGPALKALETLKPDQKLLNDVLLKALASVDVKVRRSVMKSERLGAFCSTNDALPVLMRGLTDEDQQVHEAVYLHMYQSFKNKPDVVIAPLIAMLEEHPKRNMLKLHAMLHKYGPAAKSAVPALIRRYKIAGDEERRYIVDVFGSIGPDAKAALPLLKEALKSQDELVRTLAAKSLPLVTGEAKPTPKTKPTGAVYDGKTFDQWITLLKTDKSAQRRVEGIKALAALSTGDNALRVAAMITEIGSEHSRARMVKDDRDVVDVARSELARIGESSNRGLGIMLNLLDELGAKDVKTRRFAANALAILPLSYEIPNISTANELTKLSTGLGDEQKGRILKAANDKDPQVRWHIMSTLTRLDEIGVVMLGTMLEKDPDNKNQRQAVNALRELKEKARPALPQLLSAMKSTDSRIRSSVFDALHVLKPAQNQLSAALLDVLKSNDANVRRDVLLHLESFIDFNSPAMIPALVAALSDENKDIRERSKTNIYEFAKFPKGVITALVTRVDSNDYSKHADTIHILTDYTRGHPAAVAELIRLYKDAKPFRRVLILDTFHAAGPKAKAALPIIEAALSSEDKLIREAATRAKKSVLGKNQIRRGAKLGALFLTIKITANGNISVAGKPLDVGALGKRLAELEKRLAERVAAAGERGVGVQIEADSKVPHAIIDAVMKACKKAGVLHTAISARDNVSLSKPQGKAAVYDGKTFDQWLAILKTETNPKKQAEALKAIGATGARGREREAVAAIMEVLKGDSTIFGVVAELLEGHGLDFSAKDLSAEDVPVGPKFIEELKGIIDVGTASYLALMKISDPYVVDAFIEALSNRNPHVRGMAKAALEGWPNSAEYEKHVFQLLKSPNPKLRHWAISRLQEVSEENEYGDTDLLNTSGALDLLLKELSVKEDARTRRLAAEELREFSGYHHVDDRKGQYDSEKAQSLKEHSGATATLFTLGKDKDPEVRYKVLWALTRIKADSKQLIPLLSTAIQDTREQTRQLAIDELALLAPETNAAVDALIAAYPKLKRDDQIRLVQALGKIGANAAAARPLLKDATAADDQRLREAAKQSLETIPVPSKKGAAAVYDGKTLNEWLALLKTEKNPEKRVLPFTAIRVLGTENPGQTIRELINVAGEYDMSEMITDFSKALVFTLRPAKEFQIHFQLPDSLRQQYSSSAVPLPKRDNVPYFAAECTLKISGDKISPTIIEALKDENVNRRRFAFFLILMFKMDDQLEDEEFQLAPALLPHVKKGTRDSDGYVSFLALVTQYHRFDLKPTEEKMLEALADQHVLIRRWALENLHWRLKITPPDYPIRALDDEKPSQAAVTKLKQLPSAEAKLFKATKDKDPEVRRSALSLLSAIQADPEKLVPLLIDYLPGEIALNGLGRLGPKAKLAVPKLIKLITVNSLVESNEFTEINSASQNRQTERQIIETLGKIGPDAKDAIPTLEMWLEDNKDDGIHGAAEEAIKLINAKPPEKKNPPQK